MSRHQEVGNYEATKSLKNNLGTLGKTLGSGKDENVKFISAKAISIEKYNYNSFIYQFQLESPYELKEGQHIKFIGGSGQPIMRSYTPISPIHQTSVFEFIIKLYDTGRMSRYLKKFKIGDKIKIKSTTNKYYRSKNVKSIGMIAAGTGIAPMMQVIQKVIKDGSSDIEMVLLFSNVLEEDILLKERLEELQTKSKNLTIHYTLTNSKDSWTGIRGRIDKDKIQQLLPPPSMTTQILVCGPIAMTNAMELLLNDVGHNDSMIHLFL
jgi:cytochrome-b5 reductase